MPFFSTIPTEARTGSILRSSSDVQRVRVHALIRGTAEESHIWRTTGQRKAEGGNTSLLLEPCVSEEEGRGEESCRDGRGGMRSHGVSVSASSSGEGENFSTSDLKDWWGRRMVGERKQKGGGIR